jgi:hypothetical protein
MACCSSCANGGSMCNSEKWALGALVVAFALLIYVALQ